MYGDIPTSWYIDIEFSNESNCKATLSIAKEVDAAKGPPVIGSEQYFIRQLTDGVISFHKNNFGDFLNLGSFINIRIKNGIMTGTSLLRHTYLSRTFNGEVLPMPHNDFLLEQVN